MTIPAHGKTPQAATTSSFSSVGDTLTLVSDPQRRKPAMFTMRVGIRLQLGLLVLSACLVALMVLGLATWVGQHDRDRTDVVLIRNTVYQSQFRA